MAGPRCLHNVERRAAQTVPTPPTFEETAGGVKPRPFLLQSDIAVMGDAMNKATADALGAVFATEINGELPYQSRRKIYRDLCEAGLVERASRTFGGTLPVVVEGYALTHRGHVEYCKWCDANVADEELNAA